MPQLDPTSFISQLFWLAITFSLMYFLISKVALPGIGKVLRLRQDRVQSDIEQAEKLRDEAMVLKAEYEASLVGTRNEAKELVLAAIGKEEEESAKRHAELDSVLEEKVVSSEKKIEEVEKKAVEAFSPVASSLSKQIVGKLTGIKVKSKDADKVVNKLLGGA